MCAGVNDWKRGTALNVTILSDNIGSVAHLADGGISSGLESVLVHGLSHPHLHLTPFTHIILTLFLILPSFSSLLSSSLDSPSCPQLSKTLCPLHLLNALLSHLSYHLHVNSNFKIKPCLICRFTHTALTTILGLLCDRASPILDTLTTRGSFSEPARSCQRGGVRVKWGLR